MGWTLTSRDEDSGRPCRVLFHPIHRCIHVLDPGRILTVLFILHRQDPDVELPSILRLLLLLLLDEAEDCGSASPSPPALSEGTGGETCDFDLPELSQHLSLFLLL